MFDIKLRFHCYKIDIIRLVSGFVIRILRGYFIDRHISHRSNMLDCHIVNITNTRKAIDTFNACVGSKLIRCYRPQRRVYIIDRRIQQSEEVIDSWLIGIQFIGRFVQLLPQKLSLLINVIIYRAGAEVPVIPGYHIRAQNHTRDQKQGTDKAHNHQNDLLNVFFEKTAYTA